MFVLNIIRRWNGDGGGGCEGGGFDRGREGGGGDFVGDCWYVRRQRLWEWQGVGGKQRGVDASSVEDMAGQQAHKEKQRSWSGRRRNEDGSAFSRVQMMSGRVFQDEPDVT